MPSGFQPRRVASPPPSRMGQLERPTEPQTVRGAVRRIVFNNRETGHGVVALVAEREMGGLAEGEETTARGPLADVVEGEVLELTGRWVQDARFGWQFQAESYRLVPPTTVPGIRAFLASGLISGIGPEFAGRIVEAFGEKTLEVIDHHPERLHEVAGIGTVRYGRIVEGWRRHRDVAEIMSFLQSFAISATLAPKIYKTYGQEAIRVVRENPYRMAFDIRGVGFHAADRIAQSAGLAHDAPARVQAGVLHLLREAAGDGHTFLPFDAMQAHAMELLGIADPQAIRAATAALCKPSEEPNGGGLGRPHVVAEKLPEGDKAVYLQGLHYAETNVAEYMRSLLVTGKTMARVQAAEELALLAERRHVNLSPAQRQAVVRALGGGVLVLTGGPGTGKTTTVRTIVEVLAKCRVTFLLAAPTGRAAKRLGETTHHDALTIHRLLKWDPKKGSFAHNERLPLPADFVVVDEASMLDITLMHHLLKAISPATSLLLVGDVDQLPSVGPGNVLRDLIQSGVVPVVVLDTIFRQARQSLIVTNAHRINEGRMPMLVPEAGGEQAGGEQAGGEQAGGEQAGDRKPEAGEDVGQAFQPACGSQAGEDVGQAFQPACGLQSATSAPNSQAGKPAPLFPSPSPCSQSEIRNPKSEISRAPASSFRPESKPDFFFVAREDPEEAAAAIVELVGQRIPRAYGVDPVADIQVITPMHRGVLGAAELNRRLQAALNHDPRTLQRATYALKVGDKVMQIENNYDRDVFNGDIGIVAGIEAVDQVVRVRFDRRIVEYAFADLDELVLSYAITVHKSQGSEYPVVVLPVHTQHYIMLRRNLLYTAVTRGRKLVVMVGTARALSIAVKTADQSERHSGLRQRLKAALAAGGGPQQPA